MERVHPGARQRADLVGTSVFWVTIGATLCAAVPFALFPVLRAWIGCAALLMWTSFFTANAYRSRRTHSVISAPVYLAATIVLAGSASGLIDVRIWMVWALGAGILAANLGERFLGRYL